MDRSRKVACAMIAAAAIVGFFSIASPCYGAESRGKGGGSTFVALWLTLGLRAGLEHQWPAGPGVAVAVGSFLFEDLEGGFNVAGEALALLLLVRLGRSGALDLAVEVPTFWWAIPGQSLMVSVGAARGCVSSSAVDGRSLCALEWAIRSSSSRQDSGPVWISSTGCCQTWESARHSASLTERLNPRRDRRGCSAVVPRPTRNSTGSRPHASPSKRSDHSIALAASVSGQTLGELQTGFEQFASAVYGTLASAATSGLNWSPAYIGQFPHFGVGASMP